MAARRSSGTLAVGKPKLIQIIALRDISEGDLLETAAIAERVIWRKPPMNP
jgi:hypothetical protein